VSPEQLVALIVALTGLLGAVGIAIRQIVELRREVDGRLTQLLELTRVSSVARGDLQGRAAAASELQPMAEQPSGTNVPE
jgi:hypothetical protein